MSEEYCGMYIKKATHWVAFSIIDCVSIIQQQSAQRKPCHH